MLRSGSILLFAIFLATAAVGAALAHQNPAVPGHAPATTISPQDVETYASNWDTEIPGAIFKIEIHKRGR